MKTLILLLALITAEKDEQSFGFLPPPKSATAFTSLPPEVKKESNVDIPMWPWSQPKMKDVFTVPARERIPSSNAGAYYVFDKSGKKWMDDDGVFLLNWLTKYNQTISPQTTLYDRWGQPWQNADANYLSKWIDERNTSYATPIQQTVPVQTQPTYQYTIPQYYYNYSARGAS